MIDLFVLDNAKLPEVNKWNLIRTYRNDLLKKSDWTQLSDSPLTEEKKAEWKAYRAALRDLPDSFSDPESVTFPEPPG